MGLKYFRSSGFFPTWVRSFLADFAVIIAMVSNYKVTLNDLPRLIDIWR
jgi:hypothetical protein